MKLSAFGLGAALRVLVCVGVAAAVASCGLAMGDAERLERASAAFEAGDYQAAIIDAKSVLQSDSSNLGARLLLGRASLEVGDAETALAEIRRAIELGADPDTLVVELGRALLMSGNFSEVLETISPRESMGAADRSLVDWIRGSAYLASSNSISARDSFLSALDADPSNTQAMLGVVSSYLMEGNLAQASATLDEITGRYESNVDAWLLSGQVSLQAGNLNAALDSFKRAEALASASNDNGNLEVAMLGQADAYLRSNDVDSAQQIADRLSELGMDSISTRFLEGRIAFVRKRYDEAINSLQAVQAEVPALVPVKVLLGAAHLYQGSLRQAEMQLSSAVAADPGNVDARKMLAETRARQGDADEAAQLLQPILESDSTDPGALALAARISVAAGDSNQAVEYLEQRANQQAGDIVAVMDLVSAYIATGRFDDARAVLAAMDVNTDENAKRQRLAQVLLHVAEEDKTSALAETSSLVNDYPEDAQIRLISGSLYQRFDNNEAARADFSSILDIAPDNPVGLVRLARMDLADGRLSAAETLYRQALDVAPDNAYLMIELAQLFVRQEDTAAARDWLQRAIDADAQLIAPRLIDARLDFVAGDFAEAIEATNAILAIDPGNPAASSLKAQSLERVGDLVGAVASYRDAVAGDERNLPYRTDLARALAQQSAYNDAIGVVNDSLAIAPDHFDSAALLVSIYRRQDDLDAATAAARSFVTDNPQSGSAHGLLAEVYLARGDTNEALQGYDRAMELDPSPRIIVGASRARSLAGHSDSLKPITDYLEENPDDEAVRLSLAGSYLENEDNARAIQQYERIIQDNPENAVALNNLAWAYFRSADERALPTAQRAYELQPQIPSIADTYGWILIRTGEAEEGVQILQELVDRNTATAEHRYHLAEGR